MLKLKQVLLALVLLLGFGWAVAEPVNINTADAVTLSEGIKGVGQKKAQAIVAYREAHGPFNSVDELVLVKGIGAKTIDSNRENMTVGKLKSEQQNQK